jgi:hypothetical protein
VNEIKTIGVNEVRFVKELYPRLKPHDDVVERYRDALESLPPIVVARGGALVDGYHRWQAHVREGAETIQAIDLGDISDAEIVRESIRRNATHGQQLTRDDKRRMAGRLWAALADLPAPERVKDIAELLAVSDRSVQDWTKDVRKAEKQAQQDKAWDLWLDCREQQGIADELGVSQPTINEWLIGKRKTAESDTAPESRQHFDIWQFPTTDRESGGQQSYFGAVPPQVLENLLWFYTDPGQIVVDLFAGSGTTVDVAKRMGRRVWAGDIRGDHYSPHLPIHQHDATTGWPESAPRKADLVFLDPPYWKQASGRYSDHPNEFAEMEYFRFIKEWRTLLDAVKPHLNDGGRIAFIISPTQVEDGQVIDHAYDLAGEAIMAGLSIERRIIVPYSTQQATGQQVTWARENKRMLKLYRDLVVLSA